MRQTTKGASKMTHEEMISKIAVGMTLVSGNMRSKIVKVESVCDGLVNITNEQGQTVGSMQLHDLVFSRKVITIEGI
jgi:hypothetical protein